MQLGFVIDHSRCIGCHACTVACKSENGVPVDSFRTWVKYTERGTFPEVKRSFAVLRCNQCTAAPCVTICPVNALEKRADGIVDVDPAACIGCKSCMQGCPYDALYIHPDKGTAEKCHFCAHRTEVGLAPACAVVCPTEAIIPGDFDDPESLVSRLRRDGQLQARKTEAGTGPNVFYREAAPAGLDPLQTNGAGGYLWAARRPGIQLEAEQFLALERKAAEARTTYDVSHPPLWGWKITGYLFAKSCAAGVFLALVFAQLPPFGGSYHSTRTTAVGVPILALLCLGITSLLLVLDLKRPERFLYILLRPNWSSWLVRGTYALIAYGLLLSVWLLLGLLGRSGSWLLVVPTVIAAALSACYTGWLFGQAKGRVYWMQRGLWLRLIVQAGLAGTALLALLGPLLGPTFQDQESRGILTTCLVVWAILQRLGTWLEPRLAPRRRAAEFARVIELVQRGPFARRHRLAVGAGLELPIYLLVLTIVFPVLSVLVFPAALLLLVGLWVEEDVLVRAGQALPIS